MNLGKIGDWAGKNAGPLIQGGASLIGGIGGSMIDSREAAKDRSMQKGMAELNALQNGAQMLAQRRNESIERNRGRLFRDQMLQVLGIQ